MLLQFSINIPDQLQTRQISLVDPKILQLRNDKISSIIEKFAFHQSKKFKIKSECLFNRVSTEAIKRIIIDLDIKKPSSETPTYFLKKCDFVLFWVCVNKALKTGSFLDSLKYVNVRPIYKKVDLFDKNKGVYYHFY